MGGSTSVSVSPRTSAPVSTPKPFMGISQEGWKGIGNAVSDSTKLFGSAMANRQMPSYSGLGSVSYEAPQMAGPMMNFNAPLGYESRTQGGVNQQQPAALQTAMPPRTILGMMQSPRGSGTMQQRI
jgi:hypothetical protein